MSNFSVSQRIRYRFDNALSRGIWVVLLWLGALAALFFVAIAAIISITGIGPGDERTTLGEGLWLALTRSLDSGTFSGDEGMRFRLIMLIVTLAGIFLAATIIGLISSGIDSRVQSLRRGKSLVIETGHTVIIGRSDKLSTIITELVEANSSERGRAIVVLTPDDTVEVTEDIRATVTDLKTSRLVVRSGVATRLHDLAQANPQAAKSVIVLRSPDQSDAQVVKVVLALAALIPGLEGVTVVAEIDDGATGEALRSAVGPSLLTVTPRDIIARIGAQVSRAAGLGAIYQELLDFDGDEMYTTSIGEPWVGRNFGELLLASSGATIIGLRHPDGRVELNPPPESLVVAGDMVIGIAEDDSTFVLDVSPVDWAPADERRWVESDKVRERTLIVGWSDLASLIAQEIDEHVARDSELHVLVSSSLHDADEIAATMQLTEQSLVFHEGEAISRADIERVLGAGPFDHIMLLSEREAFEMDEADARTLLALMHVRGLTELSGGSENIVAELLDPNDVELGGGASATSDFIVSQKLISLLMTQLSESPHLADVFADLFDADGAVIALHPLERYLPDGEATFGDLVVAAREWGLVAIGYKAASADVEGQALAGGIRINPPKSQRVRFAEGDKAVVIGRP